MLRLHTVLALCLTLVAGCAANNRPPDETTDDGLVRVPSRDIGGVYRAPDASFVQYQRIILEPPMISFTAKWADEHPEVDTKSLKRILNEVIELFREEFAREFVQSGPYQFAEDPGPDVLLVIPAIEDLDITAPDGPRTYARPVSMEVKGDLRDAATGKLVGRVVMFQEEEKYKYGDANRATNAHEQRLTYAKWARLVHEALNVAKAERPRPRRPAVREDQATEAPR
jgi:hypothetical protein